jgi:hypothetical protein
LERPQGGRKYDDVPSRGRGFQARRGWHQFSRRAAFESMTNVLARMPKAELHVHLEGTIAPETLWAMAERNHVALPVGAELRALYAFEGFDKFLDLWLAMSLRPRRDRPAPPPDAGVRGAGGALGL